MFGGTKLSKKSALAMNTVAEEADGNDMDERQSSVGTTTHNQGDSSSSSFSLAKQETLMLMYSKFLVITVVLTLAITLGCVTYKITRDQEMTNYRTKASHFIRSCSLDVYFFLTRTGSSLIDVCTLSRALYSFTPLPNRFRRLPRTGFIILSRVWRDSAPRSQLIP